MGMQLPDWARKGLEYIGSDWPATDEEVVASWAPEWRSLGTALSEGTLDVNAAITKLGELNDTSGYTAFCQHMADEESVTAVMSDAANGCMQIAGACETVSTIVVGLKWLVIAQVSTLLASVGFAIFTGGLGAGVAVAARKVAFDAISTAVTDAVFKVMEE